MNRIAFLLLLSISSYSFAQSDSIITISKLHQFDENSPERVVEEYTKAIFSDDPAKASEYIDIESKREIKDVMIKLAAMDSTGETLSSLFSYLGSKDSIASLDDKVICGIFLKWIINNSGFTQMKAMVQNMNTTILGHITENDSTVHVVSRIYMPVKNVSISQFDVASLKLNGFSWKVSLMNSVKMFSGIMNIMSSK